MIKVKNHIELVLKSTIDTGYETLVVFTTKLCVPCSIMKTMFQDTHEISGIPIYEVDCDDVPNMVAEAMIASAPTTVLYEHGEIQQVFVGGMTPEGLTKKLAGSSNEIR